MMKRLFPVLLVSVFALSYFASSPIVNARGHEENQQEIKIAGKILKRIELSSFIQKYEERKILRELKKEEEEIDFHFPSFLKKPAVSLIVESHRSAMKKKSKETYQEMLIKTFSNQELTQILEVADHVQKFEAVIDLLDTAGEKSLASFNAGDPLHGTSRISRPFKDQVDQVVESQKEELTRTFNDSKLKSDSNIEAYFHYVKQSLYYQISKILRESEIVQFTRYLNEPVFIKFRSEIIEKIKDGKYMLNNNEIYYE